MPNLHRQNDTLNDIREEAETDQGYAVQATMTATASEKDDNSSVFSNSSRSARFRVPSLRRRITETGSKLQSKYDDTSTRLQSKYDDTSTRLHSKYDDITSSPRSVSVSAYSVGKPLGGRSRRTSEVQSEDDTASLGPVTGLEISKDRGGSWGVGDEVVMGLE